jgi:hypothetical protein
MSKTVNYTAYQHTQIIKIMHFNSGFEDRIN